MTQANYIDDILNELASCTVTPANEPHKFGSDRVRYEVGIHRRGCYLTDSFPGCRRQSGEIL